MSFLVADTYARNSKQVPSSNNQWE